MKVNEKMSLSELQATYERQKKLLANRKFLEKLPDKGKKIEECQKKIEEIIQVRLQSSPDNLSDMFSTLTVGGRPQKIDVNLMEWTGKVSSANTQQVKVDNFADEDERDIVKILATTNQLSKIVIDEREQTPDATSGNTTPIKNKILKPVDPLSDHTFKPFRTLKHEKKCDASKFKENTAATPPIYKFDHSVSIPLEESLKIQQQVAEKMKALEMQRLGLPTSPADTVHHSLAGAPDSEEECEVYDEEEVRGGITVNYSQPEDAN